MMKSMYSGVAGLRTHQTGMDVIGNNIANVNTTGFKAQRAIFTDVIYQKLSSASAAGDTMGGTNPQQIGLGVSVNTIDTDFTPGSPQSTGYGLDLCLSGDGFFMLQDTDEGTIYTRLGNFKLDHQGNLVNGAGLYVLSSEGGIINVEGYTNISIDKNGAVRGLNENGEEEHIDDQYVGVVNFINASGLEKIGNSNYRQTANSGEPMEEGDLVAGQNGTGEIVPGYLEMSNVDLAREFTSMIVTQRGYQANSRVITVSDSMLEELVNLKR